MMTMISLYLERKNIKRWSIIVRTVYKSSTIPSGYLFNSQRPIFLSIPTHYIEFYDPYKKLIFKAEICNFIYKGLTKNSNKKRKSGDKVKYVINNGVFSYLNYKERNHSILNYEIFTSAYFTYNDFMELYNEINNKCKLEKLTKRNNSNIYNNREIITLNLN